MPRPAKKDNVCTIYGREVTLTVASRSTVKARIARGWPHDLAVSTPPTPRGTRTLQKQPRSAPSTDLFSIAWGRAAR